MLKAVDHGGHAGRHGDGGGNSASTARRNDGGSMAGKLPEHVDAEAGEGGVVGHDRSLEGECLGADQSIEGIAMGARELTRADGRRRIDVKQSKAIRLHHVCKVQRSTVKSQRWTDSMAYAMASSTSPRSSDRLNPLETARHPAGS